MNSYEYTPVNDAEHEIIELPRDTAGGGLQILLRSHTVADDADGDNLFSFNANAQTNDTDTNAQHAESGAEAPPEAPIDSAQIDPSEYDSIKEGLLGGNQNNQGGELLMEEAPKPTGCKKCGVTKSVMIADGTKKIPCGDADKDTPVS